MHMYVYPPRRGPGDRPPGLAPRRRVPRRGRRPQGYT